MPQCVSHITSRETDPNKVGLMRIHPTSRECDTALHLIVNDLGRFISMSAGG